MAGKIRKGITTYLLILVIALIAAFLICVTVMLFSPFKNILGFQYFIYDTESYEYSVTGGEESEIFDFSNIQEVKINCNYAKVTVERYVMVDNHAIKFTNNSKGFARENQDTSFSYELSYEDASKTILNVNVHEPEGFLYFSQDIKISILVPTKADYALENTKIDVTNTSGDVYIGNSTELTTVDNNEIDLNSLSVKTKSGKTVVYPVIDNMFENIFINSTSGDVDFRTELVVTDKFEIHTNSGDFNSQGISYRNVSEPAVIDIGNGKFKSSYFTGNINLAIQSGYFDVTNTAGNIVANDANAQMKSATITIDSITGVVSFPFVNGSNINIGKMSESSEFYANATSGSINIQETYGKTYIETTSGNVSVSTYADDIQVKTESGDINVVYNNTAIANQLDFTTETGTINLYVKSELAYVLAVYNTEGQLRESGVNVEVINGKFINPLTVNGGTSKIVMISNGEVNLSLISA